ncbi:MAG: EAL domain-containing protein [Candidatus Competibacteraceae bacterium]|nr:MAG: EAL domain-containing protein [Candidatus Competibacteraceae bacterium]
MSDETASILVVDDDPLIRLLAREILEQDGFVVVEATHGEEALQQFAATGADLVLLDVLMPGLDGFAACERLRQTPSGLHLPIVMMTGLEDEASIRRAYDAGATDFIAKPIHWPVLAYRLRYILRASAAVRELAWRAEFQRVLIDTLPIPLSVEDARGECLACNPAFEALVSLTCVTHSGPARPLVASAELPPPPNPLDARGQRVYETSMRGTGGNPREVIVHQAVFVPPGTGEPGLISAILDITERKRHEERLRLADTVFQTAADAIVVTDAQGVIKSVNPAFTTLTGYSPAEAIGETPRLLKSERHDDQFYTDLWRTLTETGQWTGEIWQRHKNGPTFPTWESIEAVRDADGRILEYVAFFSDISQRKLAEQEIFFRANFDPLTGLPNRSLLHERVDQSIKQARRMGRRMGLLFLDLDRFKQVNDTLGHVVGDALLCQVAERLQECVRETDTVARYSGDEFVLVLPEVAHARDACAVAEKVIERIAEPFALNGATVRIGVSIGVALYPGHGQDQAALLRHADLAMYQAKAAGRNTYRQYETLMTDQVVKQMSLETDLRLALLNQELAVHYQPILDLESGALAGAEALIRWPHPQRGMVPPSEFIPLAEDTGLIREIGAWVLERVCQTLGEWDRIGLRVPISVNLSSHQILRGLTVEAVEDLLRRYSLRSELLAFELTESVLLSNTIQAQQWLEAIRRLGIRVDIDDFGTGYSSLAYLKRFPVNRIKIDRAFVRDMVSNPNDRALVEAMLAMAHSLDLDVVAEGIEDEEQLTLLRRLGCEYAQGFYFSPAVPDADFVRIAANLGAIGQ